MAQNDPNISFGAIVQSVIGAILIALIFWLGNGMQDAKIQFTQIAANIQNLTGVVMEFKGEWKQNKLEQAAINSAIDKRLTALEYETQQKRTVSR